MSKLSAVIDKIQKLRRLSKSSNVHEAENAARAADRLIQEHGLREAQLQADEGRTDDAPREASEPIAKWGKRMPDWQVRLVLVVCRHYDCACYVDRVKWSPTDTTNEVKIIGRADDIEAARFMYTWLVVEIERLTEQSAIFPGTGTRIPRGRAFYNAFRQGAVLGVQRALVASKAVARATASSTALAVVDSRLARAEEEKKKLELDGTHRTKTGKNLDELGFHRGERAGRELPGRATRKALGSGGES